MPKKDIGSFRMIQHLFHPVGSSISDGIPSEKALVQYQTINYAIARMKTIGWGAYIAKTDIAQAFWIIPVKLSQYNVKGIHWWGPFFYDCCLTMGLHAVILQHFWTVEYSASLDSSAISVHCTHGAHLINDFLIVSALHKEGQDQPEQVHLLCHDTGIPLSSEKTFTLSTTMNLLGNEIDSMAMEVRLPLDKLQKCWYYIQTCCQWPKLTLRNLQSILGTLNFACASITPGQAFWADWLILQ